MFLNRTFYSLKPFIPRRLQIAIRRRIVLRKRKLYQDVWPIDPRAANPPKGWEGWPYEKRFALVLSHDVDTAIGHQKVFDLAKIEGQMGFHSSFNFVPERYNVSAKLRQDLVRTGFEVAVHGLNHDGKLFFSREIFAKRAIRINNYLREWQATGFNSPSMHRELEWICDLNIDYDQSTFDTDPFEPQPQGIGTIFPFWFQNRYSHRGYVELPYTLCQDFTLFIIMREKDINIWQEKLDWLVEKGGMALLNTHPDYMNFNCKKLGIEEYPAGYYTRFLEYIKSKYDGQYWHALPRDMARFWYENMISKDTLH